MRAATSILIVGGVALVLIAGLIVLQVFLSRKQSKYLGLILPGICVLLSIITVAGTALYASTTTTQRIIDENGRIIEETIPYGPQDTGLFSNALSAGLTLIVMNIPTGILLAIYAGCRENVKRQAEIERMSIQDLE